MKNIILKIPTLVFFLGLVIPTIFIFQLKVNYKELATDSILFTLSLIQSIVILIWTVSAVDIFSFESKSKENNIVIYSLISVYILFSFIYLTIWPSMTLFILSVLAYASYIVLMTMKVKSVFYARSTWFVALELLIPLIGFLTLTPEIKRWEEEEQ